MIPGLTAGRVTCHSVRNQLVQVKVVGIAGYLGNPSVHLRLQQQVAYYHGRCLVLRVFGNHEKIRITDRCLHQVQ